MSGIGGLLIFFFVLMAGEEGLEPSNAGIKIRCLNQLGDSPTQLVACRHIPEGCNVKRILNYDPSKCESGCC
jgi:hypothetical protein